MASLKQVEQELIENIAAPNSPLSFEKIGLYMEIVLLIVQFIVNRKIIVDGKWTVKWWNFGTIAAIIGLFKDIVKRLTS